MQEQYAPQLKYQVHQFIQLFVRSKMSPPSRSELLAALRQAWALIYQRGSNTNVSGWVRIQWLRLAHKIEALLLRNNGKNGDKP